MRQAGGRQPLPPDVLAGLLAALGALILGGAATVGLLGRVDGLRVFSAALIVIAYAAFWGMRRTERALRRTGMEADRRMMQQLFDRASPLQRAMLWRIAVLQWLARAFMLLAIGLYLFTLT